MANESLTQVVRQKIAQRKIEEAEAENQLREWFCDDKIYELFRRYTADVSRNQLQATKDNLNFGVQQLELAPKILKQCRESLQRVQQLHGDSQCLEDPDDEAEVDPEFELFTRPASDPSGDITCLYGPWTIEKHAFRLAVYHDRAARKLGGDWRPLKTDADDWPADGANDWLAFEVIVNWEGGQGSVVDPIYDAADIRVSVAAMKKHLRERGLINAVDTALVPGGQEGESSADDGSWVSMSSLPGWRDYFLNTKKLGKFLEGPEVRTRKPSKYRREAHAGDWARWTEKKNKANFEGLDLEQGVVDAAVKANQRIETKKQLRLSTSEAG